MADKDQIEQKIATLQDDLFKRLREIDPNVLVDLKLKSTSGSGPSPMWSDWHDRWRDRDGGWSDAFGKG